MFEKASPWGGGLGIKPILWGEAKPVFTFGAAGLGIMFGDGCRTTFSMGIGLGILFICGKLPVILSGPIVLLGCGIFLIFGIF